MSRIIRGRRVEFSSTCWRRDWREERKVSSSLLLLAEEVTSAAVPEDEVIEEEVNCADEKFAKSSYSSGAPPLLTSEKMQLLYLVGLAVCAEKENASDKDASTIATATRQKKRAAAECSNRCAMLVANCRQELKVIVCRLDARICAEDIDAN